MPDPAAQILYLDHSNWDGLIKGRDPSLLHRLEDLCKRGVVRVRLSLANLVEVAPMLEWQRRRLVQILRGLDGAVFATSTWEEVCAQELLGTPIDLQELPIGPNFDGIARLLSGRPRAQDPSLRDLARMVRVVAWFRGLSDFGRRSIRRFLPREEQERLWRALRAFLAEKPDAALSEAERAAGAGVPLAVRGILRMLGLVRRIALTPEQSRIVRLLPELQARGVHWTFGGDLVRALAVASLLETGEEDLARLPACLLRAEYVRATRLDPGRRAQPSLFWDEYHLPYIAYSTFATVDGSTLRSISPALRRLSRPRVRRSADVRKLLDEIEASTVERCPGDEA